MGLQEFDPTNYELDYIPQRLRTLELCVVSCYAMLNGKVDSTPLHIDLGTSKISEPNLRLFVDTVIDAGLVANRTLLNFIGIKLNNNNLINEEYALTVTKFGLPLTPVADAITILSPPLFSPALFADELRKIWVEVLNTASKSTAHFTEKGGTIRVARLGFASYATSLVVRKYFYQALGKAEPDTLIEEDIKPKFGGVWDSVDPTYNVRL